MRNIHKLDNSFIITKNGYPYHVNTTMEEYLEIQTLYEQNPAVFEEEFAAVIPETPIPTYAQLRAQSYPEVTEQLDKLYHDIDGGMFGESARTSKFYLARKAVKDEFPKPSINQTKISN